MRPAMWSGTRKDEAVPSDQHALERWPSSLWEAAEGPAPQGGRLRLSKPSGPTSASVQFSSVHFSRSVMSDSLRSHELQHARPPCPSPTAGVHSNSRPSSWWCHPAISFSVVPFSCPQSLPASESFPMSQLFAWGGQSTGVSALASFLPKNTQGWALRDPIKQALLSERGRCREAVEDSDSVPSSPTKPIMFRWVCESVSHGHYSLYIL